jgi:nucleotide-binding universal stress UspA family protein
VVPPAPPLGLSADARDELEQALLALIPRGADTSRVHTRAFIAESLSPGDAILQAVRRFDPDLVVMSSHGRTGLGRLVRGSVAERVLRNSPKPVLVVPASAVDAAELAPNSVPSPAEDDHADRSR